MSAASRRSGAIPADFRFTSNSVDVDAIILGAGPAGATAALNLAPFRKVLLIDPAACAASRIGESIPGAARRLLADMGPLEQFLSDGHVPRYALRSAWGDATPAIRDSIADPDGHRWQIDRKLFEDRLRAAARARGALSITARAIAVRPVPDGFAVALDSGIELMARLVIDASGRRSRLLTVPRTRRGKLSCAWLRARGASLPAGIVQIEAEMDGWWYCSALPSGDGLLASTPMPTCLPRKPQRRRTNCFARRERCRCLVLCCTARCGKRRRSATAPPIRPGRILPCRTAGSRQETRPSPAIHSPPRDFSMRCISASPPRRRPIGGSTATRPRSMITRETSPPCAPAICQPRPPGTRSNSAGPTQRSGNEGNCLINLGLIGANAAPGCNRSTAALPFPSGCRRTAPTAARRSACSVCRC